MTKQRINHILFRLLIAGGGGLVVALLAILAAWQYNRVVVTEGQWETQRLLAGIDRAIAMYQQENSSLPHTLDQLRGTQVPGLSIYDPDVLVDGWRRPFLYSVDGTNYSVLSYGRDGQPGGIGIDCDLSNTAFPKGASLTLPKEALPTLPQFLFDLPTKGIIGTCVVCGILALLVSFFTVKPPDLEKGMIFRILLKLLLTAIAALIVSVFMSGLQYVPPNRH